MPMVEPIPTMPDPTTKKVPASGQSTLSVHAGEARVKPGFSITDPIFASSTYTFPNTQAIVDFLEQGSFELSTKLLGEDVRLRV